MFIKRTKYLDLIRRFYDSSLIKVLTGIRRCGKSVLLSQIKEEIKETYNIDEDHIISINFEDVSFTNLRNYIKLNNFIIKKIKDKNKYYIFLDEIQNVRNFEKTLASLKATQNVSIFVTGSNSKLLSGRLSSLLVGRCKEFKILPFSYTEFLQYYKENNLPLPLQPLNNYIRLGGMPQRFDYDNEDDIKDYLISLFNGIIDKDICNSRSNINKENFTTLAKYIISNATKEFSATSISDYFNKMNNGNITRENIYRYLEKLEQACLISRVKRYDIASKRTLRLIEKHFVIDNGFFLACSQSNNILISHALENLIYNELIYRGYEIKIGKTYKGEIDFVVTKNNTKCFIQVAYLLSDESIIKREFSAFSSIKDSAPKYVFSLDQFDMSQDGIKHINIEDFLLNKIDIVLF